MNRCIKIAKETGILLVVALIGAQTMFADVLIDDMEGERKNRSLAQGYWFMYLDTKSHETGNTRLIYPKNYNFRYYPQGYQSANCARINAVLGAGYRSPFIGMGVNFDQHKRWYDLSNAECVEFWARGQGVFKVRLRDSISVRQTPEKNLEKDFFVTDEWKLYQIKMKEFKCADNSYLAQKGVPAKEVLKAIGTIIFASSSYSDRDAGTEVDLQIDNIVIRGISTIGVATNNAPRYEKVSKKTETKLSDPDAIETEINNLDDYQ